jgi:hypothetical protein
MLHSDGNFVGIFRLGVTPFGRSGGAQDDRFKVMVEHQNCRYFLSNAAT